MQSKTTKFFLHVTLKSLLVKKKNWIKKKEQIKQKNNQNFVSLNAWSWNHIFSS